METERQPVDITKQRATRCGWCPEVPKWALLSSLLPTCAFCCDGCKKRLGGVFNKAAWSWKKLEAA